MGSMNAIHVVLNQNDSEANFKIKSLTKTISANVLKLLLNTESAKKWKIRLINPTPL